MINPYQMSLSRLYVLKQQCFLKRLGLLYWYWCWCLFLLILSFWILLLNVLWFLYVSIVNIINISDVFVFALVRASFDDLLNFCLVMVSLSNDDLFRFPQLLELSTVISEVGFGLETIRTFGILI